MRYPASEKAEIIQLVEQSHMPAKRTLDKLRVPVRRSTAGMTDIVKAGLKRWRIIAHDRTAFGIVSRTMSAARSGEILKHLGPRQRRALAGFQELLRPAVKHRGSDTLAAAELGDILLAAQSLQHDADLLFRRVLPARLAPNVLPAEGKNIRNLFEAAPFCPWLRLEVCRAICDYALDEPPR